MSEPNCLGLDISFVSVGSDLSELPTKGAVKASIEILGNTPLRIDNGDWTIYPADGHVCLFDSSGCCLEFVRNLRYAWATDGITTPDKRARLILYTKVPL